MFTLIYYKYCVFVTALGEQDLFLFISVDF